MHTPAAPRTGVPVSPGTLDQNKASRTEFRVENRTLGTRLASAKRMVVAALAAWQLLVSVACAAQVELFGATVVTSDLAIEAPRTPGASPTDGCASSHVPGGLVAAMAPGQVARQLPPTNRNTGFYAGSMVGRHLAGRVIQVVSRALGCAFGPVGQLLGRMLECPIQYAVTRVAASYGSVAEQGTWSVRKAVAAMLLEIRPTEELCAMVVSTVGSVAGAVALAAVPIPGLGLVVGGTLGFYAGRTVGAWLARDGLTGEVDRVLRRALAEAADDLAR